MLKIFNSSLKVKYRILFYRFRFLTLYILFGFFSLIIEFITRYYFINLNIQDIYSTFLSITLGILFSFWANVKFNFKIHRSRMYRSLFYFIIISFFSGFLQFFSKTLINIEDYSYERIRLTMSGGLFIIAYFMHRKLSFYNYKKVGIAIYPNTEENIREIFNKIGKYPDFIHVDIVDKTMNENSLTVIAYRLETIKAYWNDSQIQTHIMSKTPSLWVKQVLETSDVIFIHAESEEDLDQSFNQIRLAKKKIGLALTLKTEVKSVMDILKKVDYVLLLTIDNPGQSGQIFNLDALEKIKEINNLKFRNRFILCIDGGVNEHIIGSLNSECIVSGSSVLKDINPVNKIMHLQTEGRYELE